MYFDFFARGTFVDADSKTRSALSFKGELSTPSPALRNQKLHQTPYQSQVNFTLDFRGDL